MKTAARLLVSGLLFSALVSCGDDDKPTGGAGGAGGASGAGGARTGGSSGAGGSTTGGTGGSTTGGAGGASGAGGSGGGGDARGSGGASGDGASGDGGGSASPMMSFFITSETTTTPNLGGLAMADAKCQRLGAAAGLGSKTWKAYLSTSTENARLRIGSGPWYNHKGLMIAANLEELHEEGGKKNNLNQTTGLTDTGVIVSGRTVKRPGETANEHDVLTGSLINGMVAPDLHCNNWTSTDGMKQVGHADRMGIQDDPIVAASWNAAHASTCANTSAGGGAGRYYCFATN